MKKIIFLLVPLLTFLLGLFVNTKLFYQKKFLQNLEHKKKAIERPLDKYTIENLSSLGPEKIPAGILMFEKKLKESPKYSSNLFSFEFYPSFDPKIKKSTSGLINIPKEGNSFPLVLMLRGYIDKEGYKTGDGTRNASYFFAENGFITIAPDFLGYGDSDKEAENIFEARFQTYVTALSLIKSLGQIDKWNKKDILIWGHSNGGHIALTILEITGESFPTALWAPVSKPFPYSVLYFTDQSVDKGKLIRSELAKFETLYDPEKYSLTNYLSRINAPLQIQQGEKDDTVPPNWSNNFVSELRKLDKDITYYTYKEADHNMRPNWQEAIQKDILFFRKYLK